MAASLSITPASYNGTYSYTADGSAFSATGSFCVDNSKIVSLAGEISDVGEFTGKYDNTAEGLLYTLEPVSLTVGDDLADAAAEIEAAISENFWPTPEPEPADGDGGEDS